MKKIERIETMTGEYNEYTDETGCDFVIVRKPDLDELEQQMGELLNINIILLKGGLTIDDSCLAFKRLQDTVCKCMNKTWEEIKEGKHE